MFTTLSNTIFLSVKINLNYILKMDGTGIKMRMLFRLALASNLKKGGACVVDFFCTKKIVWYRVEGRGGTLEAFSIRHEFNVQFLQFMSYTVGDDCC